MWISEASQSMEMVITSPEIKSALKAKAFNIVSGSGLDYFQFSVLVFQQPILFAITSFFLFGKHFVHLKPNSNTNHSTYLCNCYDHIKGL